MAQPRAVEAVRILAESQGGCIRPVQLRRTNLDTDQAEPVIVPCGSPLGSVCPACSERCKSLRAEQCRDGWHLEDEPVAPPAKPDDWQAWLLEKRAELQQLADQAAASGQDLGELDELLAELDKEIAKSGIRGKADPAAKGNTRRHRSTRRRQDAPDLPRREISPRTTGRVYTASNGKTYRPSMFLTLTCDSYGKVGDDGTPSIQTATTTSAPPATRSTFPRCSTGSFRTYAATSATTFSTSPPSNPSAAWPRTRTWRCVAPFLAPTCARS
jgi:hypothetical protein